MEGGLFGLEEDHATDLEDIETFPAGAEALAEVLVRYKEALAVDPKIAKVRGIQIEVEVLPASEQMHRSRVDLLHHADAIALHFRAGDRRRRRSGLTAAGSPTASSIGASDRLSE